MNAIGTYLSTKRFTWRIGRARSLPIIHRKGLDLCALDLQPDALAPDVVYLHLEDDVAFRSPGPEIQSPLEALGQTVHPDQRSFDGVAVVLPDQQDLVHPAEFPAFGVIDPRPTSRSSWNRSFI
jgi:hypothetical protein